MREGFDGGAGGGGGDGWGGGWVGDGGWGWGGVDERRQMGTIFFRFSKKKLGLCKRN